mgnify:CR=1 FL=1
MSDFSLVPYTPPVTDGGLPLVTPPQWQNPLPINQIQNIAFPPTSQAPSPPLLQHVSTTGECSSLSFPAESIEPSRFFPQNLAAVQNVTPPQPLFFNQQQAISEDTFSSVFTLDTKSYQPQGASSGGYLPSCEHLAESLYNQGSSVSAPSPFPLYPRSATIRRGPPGSRPFAIAATAAPKINSRKRTARTAGMDRDLNNVVRQRERGTAAAGEAFIREAGDQKQCLHALKELRSNLHLTSDHPSSSTMLNKAREITDDLIEFTEMITQTDRFFYASSGREVTEVLAANRSHPHYQVPVIQYLIATQETSQLIAMANNQLRNYPDQAVWINTEGTNLSRQQLEAYGFRDAEEEDFMALKQPFRGGETNLARDEREGDTIAENTPLSDVEFASDTDSDN